jgi:hypothetical protein
MAENMSAFQRATISLKINGSDSNLSPMSFSVIEFDSIYQFYPKVKLVVSDYSGIANEYLAFVDGTELEITFGATDDSVKKCKFVVAKNAVPQQKTSSNGVGGDFEIELIHDYFMKQSKKSNAYQSNISDIVSNIVSKYQFDSTDIESTLNSGYWYQPFVNDSEFIVDYLLPFAFSNSAQNTPYFAFIDSNNVFHFKSFNSMFTATPTKEITYTTNGIDIITNDKTFNSVNFSQLELSKIKPYFNCKYYNYDKDGNINTENDTLLKYAKSQGKYPIVGSSSNPTEIISLYDNDIKSDDTKNNNKGFSINLHKNVVLPDKITINMPLDKNLVCGKTVNINMPNVNSNSSDSESLRNTGKYLIESSYHIWDSKCARTMLICSKQNVVLTKDYRNDYFLFS